MGLALETSRVKISSKLYGVRGALCWFIEWLIRGAMARWFYVTGTRWRARNWNRRNP